MSNITSIKSEEDRVAAVDEIRRLIRSDPDPGSAGAERLEVLGTLVEAYEAKAFPIEAADAVNAIEFRMEQQNLAPRDLVPFLGSRSRVSEVLARKRPLTLPMVRALHSGLGIPAKLLLRHADAEEPALEPAWESFPVREMVARSWIKTARDLKSFFAAVPTPDNFAVLCRQCQYVRSARTMDPFALKAWTARVLIRGAENEPSPFRRGSVTPEFMTEVARLSTRECGPARARDFLKSHGIALVVEPHLPQTYLDGAAILLTHHYPVVGMTIRHDRLDNFWFTLMHELAHVGLHYGGQQTEFIDDLDVDAKSDPKEKEADALAGEVLIPSRVWKTSPASRLRSAAAAQHLADKLQIHPAIVAGRIRHHWKAFRMLNNIVGHRQVRSCFTDVEWRHDD